MLEEESDEAMRAERLCDELLNTALERDPSHAIVECFQLQRNGQWLEALEVSQKLARQQPLHLPFIKQVVNCLMHLGRFRSAVELLENGLERDANVYLLLGDCYCHLNMFEASQNAYEQSLALQRQSKTYWSLARVALRLNNIDAAVAALQGALQEWNEDLDAWNALGCLQLISAHAPPVAFQSFAHAAAIDSNNFESVVGLSALSIAANAPEVAEQKCVALCSLDDDDDASILNNLGVALASQRKFKSALSILQRALILAPLDWQIHLNLCHVYSSLGEFASAYLHCQAALQLPGGDVNLIHSWIAVVLSRLGDYENAIIHYEKNAFPHYRMILSYAITLFKAGKHENISSVLQHFAELFGEQGDESESQLLDIALALKQQIKPK